MKLRFFILLSIISILTSVTKINAQKQYWNEKLILVKGIKYNKSRGLDENILVKKPESDIQAAKPDKSSGALCEIYLNNYTGYNVDVYINGEWSGTIAAYNSQYFFTSDWNAKIYGKSIEGNYCWGPKNIECDSEYKWVEPE